MTEIEILNMALSGIGAKTLSTSYDDIDDTTETSEEYAQSRLHYAQTRDSLLRSHFWRFANTRATLTQDTTSPDFEFDYQYILPKDFLVFKSFFDDNGTATNSNRYSYVIEGDRLLTNETSCQIRYTKRVTDTNQFDPLFIEMLVLQLQLKFVMPLSQDKTMRDRIEANIDRLMRKLRALDRQESEHIGRINNLPWVEARMSGGGTWRQDRV